MTKSKFQNRLKVVSQIKSANCNASEEELKQLYIKYHEFENYKFVQLDIRYGPGSGKKYQDLLLEKAKDKASFGRIEFWINQGYTSEEAEKIKKEHYTELNTKRSQISIDVLEKDPEKKANKYQKVKETKEERKQESYWLDKGFSSEEAKEKVQKYIPPKHDVDSFIERHGDSGLEKYEQACKKRYETRLSRHGKIFDNPGVSKSSLRFFVPLYRLLRKSGFKKEDIMWGIKGAREFTTRDPETNSSYSYDFTILSKKLILEFNDPFWHPREPEKWNNPFRTYEELFNKDKQKLKVVRRFGFDIIYIWSDNLPSAEDIKSTIINYEPKNSKISDNQI